MKPSAKTIAARLGVPADTAKRIRRVMEQHDASGEPFASSAVDAIADILGVDRCELIEPGSGSRSPSIEYANAGDTYAPTVLYLDGVTSGGRATGRGRWAVGTWGDIVERGNYQ